MKEQDEIQYIEEKELSLKDIVFLVKDYFREVIRYKYIPLLVMIPFAIYFIWDAKTTPLMFSGNLTFMINEDEAEDIGGLSGLLGTLGIKAPGTGGSEHNLEKVLQLFRSRRIVENTLFQKVKIEGKLDYIGNHILDIYGGINELTEDYESFNGLIKKRGWVDFVRENDNFRLKSDSIQGFGKLENIVLNDLLYDRVTGNPELGISPMIGSAIDENSGIMNLSASTLSEELTIIFLEKLYDQLSDYYINKTVEKQLKVYGILQAKNDSILQVLALADYALADFEDSNRNLTTIKGEIKRTRLRRDAKIMEIMYGESIKQLEMAEFSLKRKTPYVQLIDWPKRPINPKGKSLLMGLIYSIILGMILGITYIIVRKIFRDALAE